MTNPLFRISLSEVAHICSGTLVGDNPFVSQFCTDTRYLQPGELFVALQGERFNALDFLGDAVAKGAVGALIEQKAVTDLALPLIKVADTKIALAQLANHWRSQVNIPFVAVTGSCGKTTTKAIIANILALSGEVLASQRSFNNNIGLPLTLLQLTPQHKTAVLEIGANHQGEVAYLSALARPDVAIITNVSAAHLEGFGSLEGIAKAKGEIFLGLSPQGTAVLNQDDVFFDYWKKLVGQRTLLSFGIERPAAIMAHNIKFNALAQAEFTLHLPDSTLDIQLPLMGRHNVMNALAAAAAAYALKIPAEMIKVGLETAVPVFGRLVVHKGLSGATIIDDSYNANPASVCAAISVLAERNAESVLVFGDMLELGEGSPLLHQQIGEAAKKAGIQRFFCYGPLSRYAADAYGRSARHFDDQENLLKALKPVLHEKITVLVKGSRGMDMTRIVKALVGESI